MNVQISELTSDDAASLIDLRRKALDDAPLSFLASPEDDVSASAEAIGRILDDPLSTVFGGITDRLIGMIGLYRESHLKASHKAHIWGMYVVPECRRMGAGKRLLEAAIDHARTLDGVAVVQLSVSESAEAAKHLYTHRGFQVWGTEPDAVRHNGRTATEYHMRLKL